MDVSRHQTIGDWLMTFVNQILDQMTNISKPQKQFVALLLATILALRGRVNFLNLARYARPCEKTFRRHFRRPFDFRSFNLLAIEKATPSASKKIVAFDATFIAKSGKQTFGLDFFFNSCAGRSERGLDLSVVAIVDLEQKTAYALDALQTAPACASPDPPCAAQESRVDFYLRHFASVRPQLPKEIEYAVCDGYFAKQKFVNGIVDLHLHLISKLRCDANLRYRFSGTQKPRGRKRKYAGKVKFTDLSAFDNLGEVEDQIFLYSAICYHPRLARWLRVVVVENREKPEKPRFAVLFSTNLQQDGEEIYGYYKARFQIEFLFRDAKQQAGLGDCQARDQQALHYHFNAALSTVNVAKLEFQRARAAERKVFSLSSFKQRAYNEHFLEMIISKLEIESSVIKNHPQYEFLRNYAAIAA
jgi:hypothetical protein